MKIEYQEKILKSLQFIFPDLTFTMWEKDDKGKITVGTDTIPDKTVLRFNPELLESQLNQGNELFFNDTIKILAETVDRKYVKKFNKYRNRLRGKIHTLTRGQLEYAFANSKGCNQAARVLGVDIRTFKKYVKINGMEAEYEAKKNPSGIGISRSMAHTKFPLREIIIENKHPHYDVHKLKIRLVSEFVFEEKCDKCGYSERRDYDQAVPLILDFKDGNKKNKHVDNMRLLCYNCTFLIRPLSGRVALDHSKYISELLQNYKKDEIENANEAVFEQFNPEIKAPEIAKEDLFDKFNKR